MLMKYLWVFFISMLPIIELRGAIPVGHGLGLSTLPVFIVAILGNMLPVPFIYFFSRRFLLWGRTQPFIGTFCKFCLEKGEKAGQKLTARAGRGLFIALMLFVAIPLPGTGAWTGTLAASILDMDFKSSVLAAAAGVLIAGFLLSFASYGLFGLIRP